jgi:hypothetical protein
MVIDLKASLYEIFEKSSKLDPSSKTTRFQQTFKVSD